MTVSRIARFSIMLICIVCSSACSIKLAYNNADRLVRWQVSEYVDLNADQKEYLNTEVNKVMQWHRRNHLPLYAEYLAVSANTFVDNVSEENLRKMFDQFEAWGEEVQSKASPVVVHMMANLTDPQVAALPQKLEKSNADLVESEIDASLAEAQEQWAEQLMDTLKRFTGRLSKAQVTYIERRAQAYEPQFVLWADYRRRWQADLLKLLEQRDSSTFAEELRALLQNREAYYGEEFARVNMHNEALGFSVSANVLAGLSEKQSAKFSDELQSLSDDFAELARAE